MGVIRILPPEVVNRIAAGEVIERPASVLKELVENAIDASATQVSIDLEEGGKRLLRVCDNGCGMDPEDLPLAFASHATSKLQDVHLESSLMGVESLGFRGEALASISSVSMVTVVSRTPRASHAWRYSPGEAAPIPSPGEVGTVVEVRNIFYNVPARRKFLRSGSTELSHLVQQFIRLALAFPGIRFELAHGAKRLFQLTPVDSLGERLKQVLGKEAVEGLLEVRSGEGLPSVQGFIGNPRIQRRDTRDQHLFVNGRWVRDRLLGHALRSAYQGFQVPGIQPVAFLFLEVSPEDLDVNVHPTKAEVRFRDPSQVYRVVHGAVRDVLEWGTVPPPASHQAESSPGAGPGVGGVSAAPRSIDRHAGKPLTPLERAVKEFLARPERARPAAMAQPRAPSPPAPRAGPLGAEIPPVSAPEGPVEALPTGEPRAIVEESERPAGPRAFQILQSYIVLETEDGLALIDQHALHEKIIFEEVIARLERGTLESQRLLLPEVLDVPPELMPLLDRASQALAPLGFEVAPLGPTSLAVHAFPALFDRETGPTDLQAIVRSALESLRDDSEEAGEPARADGGDRRQGTEEEEPAQTSASAPFRSAIRRIAAKVACKRAVKAGTPLRQEEIRALLERGELARDPRHCPHGRPTAVFLTRRDIERQFDRK